MGLFLIFTRKFIRISIIILVFHLWSCSSSDKAKVPSGENMQNDFTLILQEGGGFSGQMNGYTITGNGKIQHWRQFPGKEKTILWETSVDPATVEQFRLELEKSGALQHPLNKTGNMTTSVVFIRKDEKFVWSWRMNSNPLPSLQSWYNKVLNFCKSNAPSQK